MTRVDFYQLSRDPVDVTVVKLAGKVMQAGERLVVVASDAAMRERLGEALWARQGAIFVGMSRSASYAMTGWDGNPDCGLKMQVYNRAANTTARGAVRGFDVLARNRDSVGSCVWLNGGYVCAENSTGSGGVVGVRFFTGTRGEGDRKTSAKTTMSSWT